MIWVWVDLALAALVLLALVLVLLRVWRTVKNLARQVARTSDLVATASTGLAVRTNASAAHRPGVGSRASSR